MFSFVFKESLVDLCCETAVSGLWMVLMSLDCPCPGRLKAVEHPQSWGKATQAQRSRLYAQTSGRTIPG